MKKIISSLLILFHIFALTACSNGGKGQSAVLFSNPAKTEMGLYTEVALELTDSVKDSEVVWKSSNNSVISVNDGVVFGKGEGKATVSATYGEKTQSVEFFVTAPIQTPYIDETEIGLIQGYNFVFDAMLYVNGIAQEEVEYTVVSQNENVISVQDGNVLTGESFGETTLSVSASWRGIANVATATIVGKVNANEGLVPEENHIFLYALNKTLRGKTFSNVAPLRAKTYLEGGVVDDAEIVWESEDDEIAVVTENGIEARAVGETRVIGTYQKANGGELTTVLPVSVNYAELNLNDDFLVGLNETKNAVDGSVYFGEGYTVEKIVVDDFGKEYTVAENNVSGKVFDAKSGEYDCRIYCAEEKIYCNVTLVLADYVIYDAEDLFYAAGYTSSYIAVANDISNIGERTVNIYVNDKGNLKIQNGGAFSGVFNGLGHTLEGMIMNTGAGGIFERVDGGATIKNVAVTNVTFAKTGGTSGPLFWRLDGVCFIDNVYIQVTSFGSCVSCGGVGAFIYLGGLTISNSIFVVDGLTKEMDNGAICGRSFRGALTMKNTYVISNGMLCSTKPSTYNTTYDAVNAYSAYLYANKDIFATVGADGLLDFSAYNKYWSFADGLPNFS